jgi:hypothetical protein
MICSIHSRKTTDLPKDWDLYKLCHVGNMACYSDNVHSIISMKAEDRNAIASDSLIFGESNIIKACS